MNQVDLELYRWKFHNTVYAPSIAKRKYRHSIGMSSWWREYGAFVSVLPRQSGKSTRFIKTLVNDFERTGEDYMIVVPKQGMAKSLAHMTRINAQKITAIGSMYEHCFDGIATREVNLLIDEFMFIDDIRRNMLLDHDWKSVTMIGTLK